MTVYTQEAGELGEYADRIVDRIIRDLVKDMRTHYGVRLPTDDRLWEVEVTIRNFIYQQCPVARRDQEAA